jgi:hypothetical protein
MRLNRTVGMITVLAVGISAQSSAQSRSPNLAAGPAVSAGQAGGASSGWTKRTPWGDPDLQAIWNDATETPLQRDPKYGMRTTLTDEEYAEVVKSFLVQQERAASTSTTVAPEMGKPLRRTSLIIDPPNGRLPPLTPEAQREMSEKQRLEKEPRFDSSLWTKYRVRTRCIARGVPAIMHPTCYNNNYQIIQAPGYVVILSEMIHEARIILLDRRPHVDPAIKLWMGDSRGHWEGQTLVVETTNFHPDSEPMTTASLRDGDAKVTERFTRISATELDYQYTLEAPTIYTMPITASIPMTTTMAANRIMEYACIEGDRSMALSIRGTIAIARQKNPSIEAPADAGKTPPPSNSPR